MHAAIYAAVHVHAAAAVSAPTSEPAEQAISRPQSAPRPGLQALTFQEAVTRLTQYWADKAGCVQYMPMNSEARAQCC